jgi:glutaredoxin
MYKIFSTKTCPKCEQLKNELKKNNIQFEEVDMSTPESLTELAINGVFTLSAPVLQIEKHFYTAKDLFEGDKLIDIRGLLQ